MVVETQIDIPGVLGSPCTNHGESGIGWVSDRLATLARGATFRTGRLDDLFGQIPLRWLGHSEGPLAEADSFLDWSQWCPYRGV